MLMKLRNLLVLGALLFAGSASAAIVDGVRQAPETPKANVTAQEIKYGEAMYMYNVGAGQFFLGANDWNTRASVGKKGYKVYIDQYVAEGATEWDGKQFYWRDSVETQSAIKHVFMDNEGGDMWVDNSTKENRLYNLVPQGNNVYRITPGTNNPSWNCLTYPDVYVGAVNANAVGGNTRLFWNVSPATEGAQIDWIFVSVEEYNAALEDYTAAWAVYDSLVSVYNVAQTLKGKIDEAKSKGIDVAAQEAVYLDETSAVKDIEAASSAIDKALYDWGLTNASWENPSNMTSLITNASYDNNKNDGWSGTAPGFQSYNNAEHYNKTFDTYQDLKDVPAGLYSVKVRGFFRPGSTESSYNDYINGTNNVVMAYATTATGTATDAIPNIFSGSSTEKLGVGTETTATAADGTVWYVPNNMQAAGAYFADAERGPKYDASVLISVTDGKLRIGIKHEKTTSGTDWAIWDMWRLEYHGAKPEAYAGATKSLVDAVLNKYDGREAEMTVGLLDTYKATLSGVTASDAESLVAAQTTIDAAVTEVQTNIDGWVKYEAEIKRGNETRNRTDLSSSTQMSQMAAYVARQAPSILSKKALSTEELLAEVAKLTQMIEDAIRASLVLDSDVTDMFLVNANFDNKADGKNDGQGWEGKWTDINGPSNNPVMEIYGGWDKVDPDWDVYQIVKDAPQGVYEVSLNGFFRAGEHADAYAAYENSLTTGQEITSHASVYVNNNKSAFKNVYSEPVQCGELYSATEIYGPTPWLPVAGDSTGYWYPNGMYDAGVAFAAGMYKSSAHGIVANQGDELRIGVVAKGMIMREWVIFDNFRMIYRGKQAKYVQPHLQEAIDAAAVTLTQPMAKDAKALLEEAKAAAEAVINSSDGDELFNALVAIYAANDSVEASADLFAELKNAAEQLQNAMMIYESTATDEAMAAATDLFTQMMVGVEASALTKEEAQALLGQVDKVINELILGNYKNASDDNVMDFTALLASPSFEDETGAGSAAGWTGADGALGSGGYEFFQKTFDLYQELKNIPNGTYRIEVSAYERIGSSVDDYKTYKAAKDTATTYLYAGSAGDTIETKVARLASGAFLSNDAMGIEGCAKVDSLQNVELGADSLYWVANSMASAMTMFNDYTQYANTYYITVNDGTLRLGIKKEVQNTGDWVMMDNWKLYYHGTNSIYTVEEVIGTDAAVVKREIFTLGGAQVGKLQQGVNIIRNTHADGTVTVKKVIK